MTDSRIHTIQCRRIWDSRGRPTVEAQVHLADGSMGRGIAPAGASRGSHEAVDLRDGGPALAGLDIQQALAAIRQHLGPAILGLDAQQQKQVDAALIQCDGTPTKARMGGNAIVALSLAVAHAAAASAGQPLWQHLAQKRLLESSAARPKASADHGPHASGRLSIPLPEIQIFGGGAHAGRRLDIQDLMVIAPKAQSFAQALEITAEVYYAAGRLMRERGALYGVADEGGYWPSFASNEDALNGLVQAIECAGYTPGSEVAISLDIAASELGRGGRYRLGLDQRELDSDGLCELMLRWCERYPIAAIEDPLAEDDAEGLRKFTAAVGHRVQVIGDDFLVSNAARVRDAAAQQQVNAVLIKVNQAGTLSEALAALEAAQQVGWGTIVSARSGETEDTTIVDLAVGWGAGQLKVGSFSRSERMAKWNHLLRLEESLGELAHYVGAAVLPGYR